MKYLMSKVNADQPKIIIKHYFGQNMRILASKENLEIIKQLIAFSFNDAMVTKNPFRQIVLSEEVSRDSYGRITLTNCKAYFFKEGEKSLALDIGKKNSVGAWELKPIKEIKELYQRSQLIPSRWTTVDYAIQRIKLSGKSNAIVFYDEVTVKKNPLIFRLISNYFMNPNAQ